jgi:uncharacterized protein (DUF2141 family)/uncharacterized membrane protein
MRAARQNAQNRSMLKLTLALHIAAGITALVSMWIPMFAKKGAQLHRRTGTVFVAAMAIVSVTSLMLAGARFLFDARPEAARAGLFLLYVSILTGASVSTGVRVLRTKKRVGPNLHWWDIGLSALLAASSVAMAIYGIVTGTMLFAGFSVVGLVNGGGQLAYWLRNPQSPMHWWFEHMSAMLGACIAATTAFLVVNAQRWGLDTFSVVLWLAPSIVGVPVIAIWTGYYRRKFARASGARRQAPGGDLGLQTGIVRALLAVMITALSVQVGPAKLEAAGSSGTLIVTIRGLRSDVGRVRLAVFNRAAGFPEDGSVAFRAVATGIRDGQAEVRFDDLPPADYAVSMYHDENDDAKLNKRLFGIPKEGYGVSNNVVHARRAPTFEEARFRLNGTSHAITIGVHY